MNISKLVEEFKPLYFEKITSLKREHELMSVLLNVDPKLNDRLWLVGFFKYVGYDYKEICQIIHKFNRWNDYNEDITGRMVRSLFKQRAPKTDNASGNKRASFSYDELIDTFLKNCKPFFPIKCDNIRDMALWYYSRGFHVIPSSKADVKKPYPGIRWLSYQDIQPSFDMVSRWDWAHGLILIGTQQHCFLDIDMKSDKHKEGLDFFDESRLKGFAYERTRSGGYHVFGLGNMRYLKAEPVSIRGKGAYIVTSPTLGYRLIV